MKHNYDKEYFEYLIKNVLQCHGLIDDSFQKSESPDFIGHNIGLEITRADPTLEFDGFISKYNKSNIGKIKKFNKNFERVGGRVLHKDEAIVKILNLHDTFNFHTDYIYIIPVYSGTFDFINMKLKKKLKRLNSNYNRNIKHYYLGVFSPINIDDDKLEDELNTIIDMQKNYNKKYEKVIVVFSNKICVFNLLNATFNTIKNTKDSFDELAFKTHEELYD